MAQLETKSSPSIRAKDIISPGLPMPVSRTNPFLVPLEMQLGSAPSLFCNLTGLLLQSLGSGAPHCVFCKLARDRLRHRKKPPYEDGHWPLLVFRTKYEYELQCGKKQ